MSNRRKLNAQKPLWGTMGIASTSPREPFRPWSPEDGGGPGIEWDAVRALLAAGQETVQCRDCNGVNLIRLEAILAPNETERRMVWRICDLHGLEVMCGQCVELLKHGPHIKMN